MSKTNIHYMELGGQSLRVTWYYDPGHPGTMYRSNGDPGDPPEPAELYAEKVELKVSDGMLNRDIWVDITDLATALTRDPGEPGDPIQDALENLVANGEPDEPDEPPEPIPDPVPWWEKV